MTTPIKQPHETKPAAPPHHREPKPPVHIENSTDATMGEPIVMRVKTRMAELEKALAALPKDELSARADIEEALAAAGGQLTGDLAHPPATVAAALSRWLEGSKHLAESAVKPKAH